MILRPFIEKKQMDMEHRIWKERLSHSIKWNYLFETNKMKDIQKSSDISYHELDTNTKVID